MGSPRTPWVPTHCKSCGKSFGKKGVYVWNGKEGAESGYVCKGCLGQPEEQFEFKF